MKAIGLFLSKCSKSLMTQVTFPEHSPDHLPEDEFDTEQVPSAEKVDQQPTEFIRVPLPRPKLKKLLTIKGRPRHELARQLLRMAVRNNFKSKMRTHLQYLLQMHKSQAQGACIDPKVLRIRESLDNFWAELLSSDA